MRCQAHMHAASTHHVRYICASIAQPEGDCYAMSRLIGAAAVRDGSDRRSPSTTTSVHSFGCETTRTEGPGSSTPKKSGADRREWTQIVRGHERQRSGPVGMHLERGGRRVQRHPHRASLAPGSFHSSPSMMSMPTWPSPSARTPPGATLPRRRTEPPRPARCPCLSSLLPSRHHVGAPARKRLRGGAPSSCRAVSPSPSALIPLLSRQLKTVDTMDSD